MPFLDHDGNRLFYSDSGGGGPVVLLSHGAFLDHNMWDGVVSDLAPQFRCITWDERGHGMSESNAPFTFTDAAGDVLAILDALEIDDAVLVGMSQGGWITQRVALAAPDRVRGMVLVNTSLRPFGAEEAAGFDALAGGWLGLGPVGEIADAMLGILFAPTDYDGSHFVPRWQSKPPSAWAEAWNTLMHGREDITDRFCEIKCPSLFVHGTADVAFPIAFAEEMSELAPGSRGVRPIEGGPHGCPVTHPRQVSAAIRELADGVA